MDLQEQINELQRQMSSIDKSKDITRDTETSLRERLGLNNLQAFPVGSVYTSVVSTDPSSLLGYGVWSAFGAGKVPVGYASGDPDFGTVEGTGGAKTHTLTIGEIPAHTHSVPISAGSAVGAGVGSGYSISAGVTGSTGGDGSHNNLQPYIVVYMWKRTA